MWSQRIIMHVIHFLPGAFKVPVVLKEPHVVEEISVNKEVNEHKEKVKDSIRKTEVDVERFNRDLPDDV